jgi:hypothetical protein
MLFNITRILRLHTYYLILQPVRNKVRSEAPNLKTEGCDNVLPDEHFRWDYRLGMEGIPKKSVRKPASMPLHSSEILHEIMRH